MGKQPLVDALIFARGSYLFRELENCELRGTDNVPVQISVHNFLRRPTIGCCIHYLSDLITPDLPLGINSVTVVRIQRHANVQ